MNADRLAHWSLMYRQNLEKAMTEHPDDFFWPRKDMSVKEAADIVHGKMMKAFQDGSYNHDGRAIRMTCKTLGIKHTRKAINAFFAGED